MAKALIFKGLIFFKGHHNKNSLSARWAKDERRQNDKNGANHTSDSADKKSLKTAKARPASITKLADVIIA